MPSSHTLPDDPVYAFCPSYDLDNVPQQIRIVFADIPGYVPTALFALTLDDALRICNRLAGWLLPPVFGDLRRLLEARMGKAGKREYVQVPRLPQGRRDAP